MQAVLKEVLEKFLPEDAHTRSNGRVRGEPTSFPLICNANIELCVNFLVVYLLELFRVLESQIELNCVSGLCHMYCGGLMGS